MADRPRYEDDFYAWTQYQAEMLRSIVYPTAPESRQLMGSIPPR